MCAILSVCLTFEASEFNIKLFFLDRIFHKFEWWINNEKKTVHWNFCSRKSFITNVSSLLLCLFFISPRLHSIPVHFIVIFCNKIKLLQSTKWILVGEWGRVCEGVMSNWYFVKYSKIISHILITLESTPLKIHSTSFVRQGFVHHISAISAKLSEVNQSSPLLQYVRSTIRNASASEKADFHLA